MSLLTVSKRLNYTHQKRTLPSGMTIIEIERPHLQGVSIYAYFKVGSRDEQTRGNGLSHFLEHMMFRGTARHQTAFALNTAFETIGASINAATTADVTEYTVSLPRTCAADGVSLLCDLITTPLFNDIEIERKIIIEEILEDLDDDGHPIDLDILSRKRLFSNSNLQNGITGTIDNVAGFTTAHIRQWYQQNYCAQNLVMVICGDIQSMNLGDLAAHQLEALNQGTRRSRIKASASCQPNPPYVHQHKPGSQTAVRVSFAAMGLLDERYHALKLLIRLLDDGMSTPLHRRIFEERGLAYQIGADLETYEDCGALNIEAAASHNNVRPIVEETLAILDDLSAGRFTDKELDKAKARAVWDTASIVDFPGALCAFFGEQELFRPAHSLEYEIERTLAVKRQEIVSCAQSIINDASPVITTVGQQTAKQQTQLSTLATKKR